MALHHRPQLLPQRAAPPLAPSDRILDAPALDPDNDSAPQFADPRIRTPDELALVDELELKVEAAVADLPETQRTALLLFQREELPYEDIAKILGVSLSATKSLIHRARETLKQRLKPSPPDRRVGSGRALTQLSARTNV